jgi:hypothetical protein
LITFIQLCVAEKGDEMGKVDWVGFGEEKALFGRFELTGDRELAAG